MYVIPAGSIAEYTILGVLDGQVTMTTFHYQLASTQADGRQALIDGMTDFEAFVLEAYRPRASNEWQNLEMKAQWVYPERYQPVIVIPADQTGGQAGAACPSGVAVVSRRKGEIASRKAQGRVYWPGIPFVDVVDSQMSDAWMDTYADQVANALIGYLNLPDTTQMFPVIWNFPNATEPHVVASVSTDRVLRYQRRRELRVGI